MTAKSTRTMAHSEGCYLSFSSPICQSTTLQALPTPNFASIIPETMQGYIRIKGAR